MCNMAAYAGNSQAAPILFRMLQEQEALGGGHYSGIVTMHEGKLHMRKVCGSTAELLKRCPDVLELPGTVGIAHSRTPGFDSDAWAQPFFASAEDDLVYCANGTDGRFGSGDVSEDYTAFIKSGHRFRTSHPGKLGNYPVGPDGQCIHASEFKAALVRREIGLNDCLRDGLSRMFKLYPTEIAALSMRLQEPGKVSALRFNQPLMLGRRVGDGLYLATSALALEAESLRWIQPVPACSVATMSADHIDIETMDSFISWFRPCDPWLEAYAELDAQFANGAQLTIGQMGKAISKFWDSSVEVAPVAMLVYEYLRTKLAYGKLERVLKQVPGTRAGTTVPCLSFKAKS